MGTAIAALITILMPIIILSFGTVNRDKRDVAIRKIAEELELNELVKEIDYQRRLRVIKHVRSEKPVAISQVLTRSAMALSFVAFFLSLVPLGQSIFEGQPSITLISMLLTGVSILLALVGLGIMIYYWRSPRKSREAQRAIDAFNKLLDDPPSS
ncbi:hypothetical protein AALI21_02695 [Corynebacteriaceae bacterium 6-324]